MSEQDNINPIPERYEFARAVIAMTRLAQLDLRAVDMFGKTPQAALRALRFLYMCVPLVMLLAWYQAESFVRITGYSAVIFALFEGLRVLVTSFGFLLFMHHMTRRLGVGQSFAHYVCVQCYLALPVLMVVVLLKMLWLSVGVADDTDKVLQVLVYAVQIVIDWAITYATLRVRPTVAFAICALAVLFNMLVQYFMIFVVLITARVAL